MSKKTSIELLSSRLKMPHYLEWSEENGKTFAISSAIRYSSKSAVEYSAHSNFKSKHTGTVLFETLEFRTHQIRSRCLTNYQLSNATIAFVAYADSEW